MNKYLLLILGGLCLVACVKKPDTTPTNESAQVSVAKEKLPTVEQALDAVIRAHPNAKQVCYEPSFNGYLLEYSVLEHGAKDDGYRHGWQLIQNIKLYFSSNDTWFMTDLPEDEYFLVFPDVKGLQCKIKGVL